MKIVGAKYEDELAIIDRGGLNYEVVLGEFDREYNDGWAFSMKMNGDDGILELHWHNFNENFLEKCLLKRIHADFQYPLVRYLKIARDDDRLGSQLEWMKYEDYEKFIALPFSDEMKKNWAPLVKLLSN